MTPLRLLGGLLDGNIGGKADEIEAESLQELDSRGKMRKVSALYAPFAPPPGPYLYDCLHCRFWQDRTCQIVGVRDDPFGGEEVSPIAWCILWLPRKSDRLFGWLT